MSVVPALPAGRVVAAPPAPAAEAVDLDEVEVVEGELVDDELLPATVPPAKPLVDQHTILYPGQAMPTMEDGPRYTRRDYEVSPETARRLEEERRRTTPTATTRTSGACSRSGATPWAGWPGPAPRQRTWSTART
ncbi:hypothetical protein [Streptomyces sp. NPDC046727]|uniref:hypothetical protein n=1 Tax=Streptomyces sp. NPDC046727 TaxID=3155373 RepID=UPI0033C9366F